MQVECKVDAGGTDAAVEETAGRMSSMLQLSSPVLTQYASPPAHYSMQCWNKWTCTTQCAADQAIFTIVVCSHVSQAAKRAAYL